ncbi:MAG: hypothetical protein LBQ83_01730 [Candidatus Margulisbacteria bacterium]|nr:hypothetical protein [Candidatus Margulisiibacteriota bacterium]
MLATASDHKSPQNAEELAIVLLAEETPGWLRKIILCDKRMVDIICNAVYMPYFGTPYHSYSSEKYFADEQAGTAEMDRVYAQAQKAVEWAAGCPPEYLPVKIDPYPADMQDCAVVRLGKELDKLPADRVLTVISLDILPAWVRRAAELSFAGRAPAGTTADAQARRRRRSERMKRRNNLPAA